MIGDEAARQKGFDSGEDQPTELQKETGWIAYNRFPEVKHINSFAQTRLHTASAKERPPAQALGTSASALRLAVLGVSTPRRVLRRQLLRPPAAGSTNRPNLLSPCAIPAEGRVVITSVGPRLAAAAPAPPPTAAVATRG